MKKLNLILFFWFGLNSLAFSQETERARDLGIIFSGTTGKLNAITDVQGVTVGHKTIIKDLENNKAVRTGVTVILPRGEDTMNDSVFGGWFSLNGNGEMTGTSWIEESGFLEGPIALTNTHSVGVVHDALIRWRVAQGSPDATGFWWSLPVVAETYDGYLNDINGFHVKSSDVFEALENAKAGPVNEGNVGSGTGMTCHAFKCGIGTASRIVEIENKEYAVGVLVQANYGSRENLRIGGLPIGELYQPDKSTSLKDNSLTGDGSIIIVIATDAPLLSHQLKRLARRATLGLGRLGSIARNGSGDIFVAFSTANKISTDGEVEKNLAMVKNDYINPIFKATVEATDIQPTVMLRNGVEMPRVNLGTCCGSTPEAGLQSWLAAGGTGIDTAWDYKDQTDIARILQEEKVPRENVFILSKVPAGFGNSTDCNPDPQIVVNYVEENLRDGS